MNDQEERQEFDLDDILNEFRQEPPEAPKEEEDSPEHPEQIQEETEKPEDAAPQEAQVAEQTPSLQALHEIL